MNRPALAKPLCSLAAALAIAAGASFAPEALAKPKPAAAKPAQDQGEKSACAGKAKSHSLGRFGDWEVLTTTCKEKACYALGAPLKRQPESKLKDTAANIFITTRPGEGVRNEVAIGLGYPTKENGAASADIDGDTFELVTTGANAWLKNAAKEKEFVEALKGGAKLLIRASSAKGTATTDTYSLKGLSEALARVQQECK